MINKKGWAPKNWCLWTVVLEKTLENPLDSKKIKPVNPKGNQSWIFTGRTVAETEAPILWASESKSWLIGKDLEAGKGWSQKKGWQRMRWLVSITDSMYMNLSKLREIVEERRACVLQSMGSQWVRYNLATEQQQMPSFIRISLWDSCLSFLEISTILCL